VDTAEGNSGGHLIPFGNHIIDCDMQIGKGGSPNGDRWSFIRCVRSIADLINNGQIALVPYLFKEPADDGLVSIDGHGAPSSF
jgi:hypothetical protein